MSTDNLENTNNDNTTPIIEDCEKNSKLCYICMDREWNTIAMPCKHGGVCSNCFSQIKQNKKVFCPMCRNTINCIIHNSPLVNETTSIYIQDVSMLDQSVEHTYTFLENSSDNHPLNNNQNNDQNNDEEIFQKKCSFHMCLYIILLFGFMLTGLILKYTKGTCTNNSNNMFKWFLISLISNFILLGIFMLTKIYSLTNLCLKIITDTIIYILTFMVGCLIITGVVIFVCYSGCYNGADSYFTIGIITNILTLMSVRTPKYQKTPNQ